MPAQKIIGTTARAWQPGNAREHLTSQDYQAPELQRLCHRPGAYDAFDKPSIYAGRRVPYAPPKATP